MAAFAVGRELGLGVVGICSCVIIVSMASETAVRGVVVIAIVAIAANAGNIGMSTQQLVIIVVNGKCGRDPVRVGGMTGSAVVGDAKCQMIRVL